LSSCQFENKSIKQQTEIQKQLEYLLCGDSMQVWRNEKPSNNNFSNYFNAIAFYKNGKACDLEYYIDRNLLQPSWFIMSWKITSDSTLTVYRNAQCKDSTVSKFLYYNNDTLFFKSVGNVHYQPYYRIIRIRNRLNLSKDTIGGKGFEPLQK
jgi:hypothetical protein